MATKTTKQVAVDELEVEQEVVKKAPVKQKKTRL